MKIAIIGASSQVGSSLAFWFKQFTAIEPVCFIRSSYSTVFFDIASIEYRLKNSSTWTKEELSAFDTVIDCTYPGGQLYEINDLIKKQLRTVIPLLAPGTVFIYMSTIMAFGMPDGYKQVKNFKVPHSTYAYLKRKAENEVRQLSEKYKVEGFNFRLGQVHGFLQSVNSSYREKLSMNKDVKIDGVAAELVNIIFIPTLAEAIIQAATKKITPGLYSLVNEPQWNLSQLYEYYKQYFSFQNKIEFSSATTVQEKQQKRSLISYLKTYRPLIETFLLIRNKRWYLKVKGKYRVLNIKRANDEPGVSAFTDFHLLGENPGKMISNLSCSMDIVLAQEKKMESLYNDLLEKNRSKVIDGG